MYFSAYMTANHVKIIWLVLQVLEINPDHSIIKGLWQHVQQHKIMKEDNDVKEEASVRIFWSNWWKTHQLWLCAHLRFIVTIWSKSQVEEVTEVNSAFVADGGIATTITKQLFDNALITAGLVDDPRRMLDQLNDLMLAALTSETTTKEWASRSHVTEHYKTIRQ